MTDTPPVVPARMVGLDLGPACGQCGGMMQRTGACYTCYVLRQQHRLRLIDHLDAADCVLGAAMCEALSRPRLLVSDAYLTVKA